MTDHKLDITDGAEIKDSAGSGPVAETSNRKTYVVTDKAVREATEESIGSDGIFKNGQLYKPGDEIELDELSAANFKELGEVEDAQ